MAIDLRQWNLGGVLVLAACGSPAMDTDESSGLEDCGDSTCCGNECGYSGTAPEPECIDDSDCPDLNVCLAGSCAPVDSGQDGCDGTCCSDECGDDDDSGDTAGDPTGESCAQDSDCYDGACIGGACANGTLIPVCAETLELTAFPIAAIELSPAGINAMVFAQLALGAQPSLVFSDGVRLGIATTDATTTLFELEAIDEPRVLAAADFDGDGAQDLLVRDLTDPISATYRVGVDGPVHMASFASENSPSVRDMDGDGLPDLLVLYANEGLAVLEGLGDGAFGEPSFVDLMVSADIIGHADVDGDARADLLSSARDLYFLDVNYAAEEVLHVDSINPQLEPYGFALAEISGVRDLVLASGHSGGALIEHVTGDGTLVESYVSSTAGYVHGVASFVGASDRDVVVDQGVVTGLSDAPCVLEFGPTVPASIAIGDFGGDARDEVMIRDARDNALYVARAAP